MENNFRTQKNHIRFELFVSNLNLNIFFLLMMLAFTLGEDLNHIDHATIFAIGALILIIIRVISIKRFSEIYKRFSNIGLNLFFIGFGLLLTEFAASLKDDYSIIYPGTLTLLIPIQTFCMMVLVSNLHWFQSCLIYLLNVVYFMIRVVGVKEFFTDPLILTPLLMGLINFTHIAYNNEKTYRQLFKFNHESHESLKIFHLLLKNVIPSAIYIIDYNQKYPKMDFLNNRGLKLLRKNAGTSQETSNSNEKRSKFEEENHDFLSFLTLMQNMKILDQDYLKYNNNLNQLFIDFFLLKNNIIDSKIIKSPNNSPTHSPLNKSSNQEIIEFLTLTTIYQKLQQSCGGDLKQDLVTINNPQINSSPLLGNFNQQHKEKKRLNWSV